MSFMSFWILADAPKNLEKRLGFAAARVLFESDGKSLEGWNGGKHGKGSGNTMCHTYNVSMPGMPSRQASIGSAKSWVRDLSSFGCRNLFGCTNRGMFQGMLQNHWISTFGWHGIKRHRCKLFMNYFLNEVTKWLDLATLTYLVPQETNLARAGRAVSWGQRWSEVNIIPQLQVWLSWLLALVVGKEWDACNSWLISGMT